MRLRTVAFVLLCLFGLSLVWAMQPTRKRNISRNKPADKRVYLVHSDQLRYDQYRNGDAQILCISGTWGQTYIATVPISLSSQTLLRLLDM